ncbi:hypothetical protein E4U43_008627 [Claviceps pusilla]|uniref:LysM domain-containing protein n=1 Tax=Claviceps pusilla TaxID=123648 RepID=A0A9P7SZJ2_9HYPO|nr:hypothetical protein E4U43_008627 [Claviceps pusilla]
MRFSAIALAAFVGLSAAQVKTCRHDRQHPGLGWYWVLPGETVDQIAGYFHTTRDEIVGLNRLKNADYIQKYTTIVVPCA